MEIQFLQQLIDTRGPNNDSNNVSGSNQAGLFLRQHTPAGQA